MGVELNTHDIPDLVLSDTFHEWFTVTNNSIIDKLNRLMIYDVATSGGSAGDGISAGYNTAGLLHIEIGSTIEKDITFNGNITVNGSTTTINSTEFTVDDFNLILGHTGDGFSANDEFIMNNSGNSAGGGIIVNGASGDKEFLWKYPNAAWNSNQNIAIASGKSLLDEVRIATGASGGNATKGLIFGFTAGTTGGTGTGSNALIQTFNTDIATEHSADAMYINDDGYVSIVNGANKITVEQTGHGFSFGMPVYMQTDGTYAKANATNREAAEVIGVVSRYYTDDKFEITLAGEIVGNFALVSDESATLTPGNAYFLSTTSGQIAASKPTGTNQIQKTVLIALDSDRAIVKNYIGGEVNLILDASNSLRSNRILIVQEGHGLTFGDAVRISDIGTFVRCTAAADVVGGADVVGIVDNVEVGGITAAVSIVMSGKFDFAGGNVPIEGNAGEVFYLDPNPDSVPNVISGSDDGFSLDENLVNKPVFVSDGASGGIVTNWRGIVDTGDEDDFVSDVPVGSVMAWAGPVGDIPDGFVLCDGRALNGQFGGQYEDLYNAIGNQYGGSGATDFRVPNLSARFIVGYSEGTTDYGNLGNRDGEEFHTLTIDEMPAHDHPRPEGDRYVQIDNEDQGEDLGLAAGTENVVTRNTVRVQGGDQPHENRPPYFVLAWIIRAEGSQTLPDGTQILGGDTEFAAVLNYDHEGFGEQTTPANWTDADDPTIDIGDWIHIDDLNSGYERPNNPPGGSSESFVRWGWIRSLRDPSVVPYYIQGLNDSGSQLNTAPLNDEKEWILEIARLRGNGLKPGQIRSVDISVINDNDFFQHSVQYYNEELGRYVFLSLNRHQENPPMVQSGYSTDSTFSDYFRVPVAANQTQLKFKITFRWHFDGISPHGEANAGDYSTGKAAYPNHTDSAVITVLGVNQIVDNSLTRLKKSYTDRKNLLINGNFDFWQRGNGIAGACADAGNFYSADRWQRLENLTDGVRSIERKDFTFSQKQVPHYPEFYMEIQGYDNAGTPTSSGFSYLTQKIEDSRTLASKNMTISFWAKGSSTGTAAVGFSRFYGGSGNPDHRLIKTIALAEDEWKQYIMTVRVSDLPASVSSRGNDSEGFPNDYLGVNFITYAKAGQLGLSSTANDIKYTGTMSIAQVQVEEGARATEFEILSSGEELNLAQRYYQRTQSGWNGRAVENQSYGSHTTFATEMRSIPTAVKATELASGTAFNTASLGDMTFGYGSPLPLTQRGFMPSRKAIQTGDGAYSALYDFDAEL